MIKILNKKITTLSLRGVTTLSERSKSNWVTTLSLSNGFTLIELLIVIAIIGIMAGFVITNLQGSRERARDTRRKADLESIHQSLRLYYIDAKGFPASNASFEIMGCNTIDAPLVCRWGVAFATATTYMSLLPTDPLSTATPPTYQYYSTGSDTFLLVAKLENISDAEIVKSQTNCDTLYSSFGGTKDTAKDYLVCAQ